ncbi:universal stress protein [Streptomyces ossamyceticus]|uniref:Universal stress protein n=1 Tax=Streptomyces ossamyceticus TaxID=249581 RepID=A0ABV2VBW6_9ACTN
MPQPIVAGVDGSAESLAAAAWAAREAVRRSLPLHLLHASHWSPPGARSDAGEAVPRHAARRILHEAGEHIARTCPGVLVTDTQVDGPASTALLHAADQADLLVLGSRGHGGSSLLERCRELGGGFAGFLVGSVAQTVVARASRPVVLVRAGEEPEDEHLPNHEGNASTRTPPCHEVVLGLDLADPCDEVIGFAFEAAQVRGATLHAVSTWTGPSPLSLGPGEIGLLDPLQLDEEWRRFLSAVLQPWREKFPDVEVSQTVTEGKAGARLVYASSGASLLVVGHRIRGAALGFRTGPVAHTVIHHANCPIAVVAHD